jgi:N4-gp56 family major capsid protein
MPIMNWTQDAAAGNNIWKNHLISDELLEVAVGQCVMLPFTTPVEAFGKHAGETVNIPHRNPLPVPANAELAEDQLMPIDKFTFGSRAITVVEMGRGVMGTNLFSELSVFNMRNIYQKALYQQMEESMDNAVGSAFRSTANVPIVYTPTSLTGGVFSTNGTAAALATFALQYAHVEQLSDYLMQTIHVPPVAGTPGHYIMCASTKTLRSVKSSDKTVSVALYLRQGDLFFRGEQFMVENIRFIQVTREGAMPNTAGTSTVLGDAVLFGDEAVARAEAETPHLRLDTNYQSDFGRRQAAAWYAVLRFISWWSEADDGKAKIIRISSL